ncbi:MAG: hypothetical protein NC113_06065 [Bacteroides sp.]|nr:hypothetical protein [Bacteroides sp.]MCM1447772.1 hypothetical protein [Bacteroides sp.]
MKKMFFIAFLATVAGNVSAQLTVFSDGNVGIGDTSAISPKAVLTVNGVESSYAATAIGKMGGLYGASHGKDITAHGVFGTVANASSSTTFRHGVIGSAVLDKSLTKGWTYGVKGMAGNSVGGQTYGVFGALYGTANGAGVYGNAYKDMGISLDNRYAGYFRGLTMVRGDFNVTGAITGLVLGEPSSAAASVSALSEYDNTKNVSEKLSSLLTTCYYKETAIAAANAITYDAESDTLNVVPEPDEIEVLSAERVHYGIDVTTLKESFPELVYEREDGRVSVNYMELIPILVQAINELRTEVKVLKANGNSTRANGTDAYSTIINISADGRTVGTKKVTNIK